MSDDHAPSEDNDLVAEWIRNHPEVWDDAFPEPSEDDLDADARRVLLRSAEVAALPARRRRRTATAIVVGAVVLASGSAGVAALIRSGQPTQPALGIACRAAEGIQADAIVIPPDADPIAACTDRWADGDLGPVSVVPSLTMCIAATGVVEVYPGDAAVCERLGLASADNELSAENQAVLALNDRLVEEINLAVCRPTAEVLLAVQDIVDDAELAGWIVRIRDDAARDAECAKAALDQPAKTVFITKFP